MKPVYTKEDCNHFVGYSDLVRFVVENSDIDPDEAIDLVYEEILGLDEFYSMYKRSDYENLSEDDYKDNTKTYWIGSFFMSHPFMNTIYFVYEE